MPVVRRYWRPSAIATLGEQIAQDINLPPPAPRGPRIAFSITRTMTSEPDSAEISVWNLAPERETAVVAKYHEVGYLPITLAAGYEGATSIVFRGEAHTVRSHVRQGPDYALVVSSRDAGDVLADLVCDVHTAGIPAETLILAAVAKINAGDPSRGVFPYPLAPHPSVAIAVNAVQPGARTRVYTACHAGKVRDLLDEACRILRCRWWIGNGLLYFAANKLPTDMPALAVVLPRKTWLSEPQLDAEQVIKLDAFFDPMLLPGSIVILEGRVLPGVTEPCRVEAVTIAGDTRAAQPWSSSLIMRRIAK